MKLIAQADVVLALGTRLGPFGTLPQHGLDYWPKQAKIIQIDADPRMLGLVKPISVGIHGDARAAAAALHRAPEGPHARRQRRTARERAARIAAEKASLGDRARRLDARARPLLGRGRARLEATCIRGECCGSSRRRCRRTPWCRPTSATSARWPIPTCASRRRARCSPP